MGKLCLFVTGAYMLQYLDVSEEGVQGWVYLDLSWINIPGSADYCMDGADWIWITTEGYYFLYGKTHPVLPSCYQKQKRHL